MDVVVLSCLLHTVLFVNLLLFTLFSLVLVVPIAVAVAAD